MLSVNQELVMNLQCISAFFYTLKRCVNEEDEGCRVTLNNEAEILREKKHDI